MPDAYLTRLEAVGYRIPGTFRARSIDGLEEVDVLRGNDRDEILARFKGQESAQQRESELRMGLALTGPMQLRVLAESRKRRQPFWPATPWARVERVVAAGGIVLALANYGETFFASPNVTVRARPTQDVVVGQATEVAVQVYNHTDANTSVDLNTTYPGTWDPPTLALEPRESKPAVLRTNGPVQKDDIVAIALSAKAGWFMPEQTVASSIRLVTWPVLRFDTPSLARVYRSGLTAEVSVPVVIGPPATQGLSCEALLTLQPGITVAGASPSVSLGLSKMNTERDNELASRTWVTPSIDAYQQLPLTVYLESSTPRTEPEWRDTVQRLSVGCRRRN